MNSWCFHRRQYQYSLIQSREEISSIFLLFRLNADEAMRDFPLFADLPSIHVTYAVQLIQLVEDDGFTRDEIILGMSIPADMLIQPDGRITPLQFADLIDRCMQLSKDPGLGYRFGLEVKPSAHGLLGFAMMTCKNIREAVHIAERFMSLRTDLLKVRFFEDGDRGVFEFGAIGYLGDYRRFVIEVVTSAFIRVAQFLLGKISDTTEIWVDYPEPDYYRRWQDRLPPIRFGMPSNQLRFPAAVLERPLSLSDPLSMKSTVAQLETELTLRGATDDIVLRTRAAMDCTQGDFPSLAILADRFNMSQSTLKRRLQSQGVTFQEVLDESRRSCAMTLLGNPSLSIDRIALTLGYADGANFTRAFKKWTGMTPAAWRENKIPFPESRTGSTQ